MNKENKPGGKGDTQRKTDHQKYSENYEKIFRSKQLEFPFYESHVYISTLITDIKPKESE